MARIAAAAGGVDDFLIGSELVGLTRVRNAVNTYPAVTRLTTLAQDVKAALGAGTRVSYAADWSEYHSHQWPDGSLQFNMDPLWAACDFIGIDNYLPLSDWRDSGSNLDGADGTSIYDPAYLTKNIEGGEYYDWFYASDDDRTAQTRTPVTRWQYRQKDLRGWWSSVHRHLDAAGVEGATTALAPESKPIVFCELGCPAVDKGSNQPNVFFDPKSSDSALPYFSNGRPDAAIQRAYLEAWLDYWSPARGKNEAGFIEWGSIALWTWDARPYPTFPRRGDYWGDAANWQLGHWLTGRAVAGRGFHGGDLGPFAYTNGEEPITRAGITYEPWPISHPDYTTTGTLDKSNLTVDLARGSPFDALFNAYAPSQVVSLFIFQGHMGDEPTTANFPLEWSGQVASVAYRSDSTLQVTVESTGASMRRPGLRRNYQLGCPHALYGEECRAKMAPATITRTVSDAVGNRITVAPAPVIDRQKYVGGMVMWVDQDGRDRVATITNFSAENVVSLRGYTGGIGEGDSVKLILGCNRTMADCRDLHGNILNFGGQPFIPLENPHSDTAIFY